MNRGQSNVVGVALLLGVAVVSMGTLTAAVGIMVDSTASEADAERVAADLETVLEPVGTTGVRRGTVTFGSGSLGHADRSMEVRADGNVVERVTVDALVFESGDRRVAYHAGAIVRGSGERAWIERGPPISVDDDVIVIGAPRLGDGVQSVGGQGGVTATVATDVSHDRRHLGGATFAVAVETAAPDAWARQFRDMGATVEREDGSIPVVVATFGGERTGYLVIHDLDAEVRAGD